MMIPLFILSSPVSILFPIRRKPVGPVCHSATASPIFPLPVCLHIASTVPTPAYVRFSLLTYIGRRLSYISDIGAEALYCPSYQLVSLLPPCLQQVACLPDTPASDISTPLQQATCSSFAVPSEEDLPCRILCPHSISFLTGSDNRPFSAHARREKVKAPNIVPFRTSFIL